MLKNYIKTAFRQIRRYKFYSILSVFGLGLALATCLFIYTYNSYQLSFDRSSSDADRTFLLVEDLKLDKLEHNKGGAIAMFEAIKNEIPEVERAILYTDKQEFTLKIDQHLFNTGPNAAYVTSDYFNFSSIPWIAGNKNQLDEPYTVALSEKLAKQYFGNSNPIGKTIEVEGKFPVKVVGILSDSHDPSDFHSDIYFSWASMSTFKNISKNDGLFTNWGYTNSANNIIVTLRNAQQKEKVEQAIHDLVAKHWHKDVLQYYTYKLLPITAYHFDKDYGKGTQASLLWILALIASGILLMAIINYSNIVAAQQIYRSTEMAIRKIAGSTRKQLFLQFIIESLIISLAATLFGGLLFWLALHLANLKLFQPEYIQIISYIKLIILALGLWFLVAFINSIYPILFLNRTTLVGSLKKQETGSWSVSKTGLLIVQNTIAILLVSATVVVVSQVRFLQNSNMGYDREAVLVFPLKIDILKDKDRINQYLSSRSDITAYTFCDNPPSNDKAWGGTFRFDNRDEWETWAPRYAIADSAYIKTFGIQLVAGRNYRTDAATPEYLINELMAKTLGFDNPAEILGKPLHAGGMNDKEQGIIVGVVQNFNTNSLNEDLSPTVIGFNESRLKNLAIKYSGSSPQNLLVDLEKKWNNWYPNSVLEYQYLDDRIAQLYQKESLLLKLIWISAVISLIISSVGLLGLLSIMIVKRTKEIGIRKVLGASRLEIIRLLSSSFIRYLIVAFIIALPIGWLLLNRWLESFVFKIQIQWWMFAFAGITALIITLLTISIQAFTASKVNPVDSLRDE